jgi:regulator of sigma E protease
MQILLAIILVLGPLVFVHEFGHFLFAKLFNVKVLKFSLGFGPRIFGKKIGETEYAISAIPLGGFVKMTGENVSEELDESEKDRSFALKPVWQRFIIVFAGPGFNFIFTFLIFFGIFAFAGLPIPQTSTTIGEVVADGAGAQAGLQAGDTILEINSTPLDDWQELHDIVTNSKGEPLAIEVRRGEETLSLIAAPASQDIKNMYGETTGTGYRLGVVSQVNYTFEEASILTSIEASGLHTYDIAEKTIISVYKLIRQDIPSSELGGPIMIAKISGQYLEAGWLQFLSLLGLLSINLGLLNLFPIPVLDGGHLAFFTLEAIRKKPLPVAVQEKFMLIGLIMIITLMTFAFYNDIVR